MNDMNYSHIFLAFYRTWNTLYMRTISGIWG